MYGEMLREGWADDAKKLTYYDYIFSESERLSRLINNILQLSRMTRNELHIELKSYSMAQVIDTLRSKVTSQVERHGFEFELNCHDSLKESHINIDMDYLIQIIINLTDNAVKFSSKAARKRIEITCRTQPNQRISISVRDYGPGIAKDQLRKIFKLFYRTENELTRETVGTGIGLALVNQLTHAMNGTIDVIRHEPGVEFVLSFPQS
jgi:signal transduction histidine kinase